MLIIMPMCSKLAIRGLFICLMLLIQPVMAFDGIMLNYGTGMNDALIQNKDISGASQKSIGVFWKTDTHFEHGILRYAELEIEGYIARIEKQQTMKLVAIRPVLSFWQDRKKTSNWYWQFGLGLSYFDKRELQPLKFSNNTQIAVIFGVGLPLDINRKQRLTLRYNHYSNAYLSQPNHGLDTFSLDWHYRF